MTCPRVILAVGFSILVSGPVYGQEIRFDPRPDWPAERRFEDFLEANRYVIISSDTVIRASDRIDSDILVLEADVRIEGEIAGDIAVVGDDLFLRPGARIGGQVLVLGGGYYSSQRAEVGGLLTYRPNDMYEVRRGEAEIRIRPIGEVLETLTLHGLSGIGFPSYQRVDGWTFGLGATVRQIGWDWQPSLEGRVRLKTDSGKFEGTVRQTWYPSGSLRFGAEAERATRSNENWVRSDIANTLSFLIAGDDFRNYYEADRVAFFLRGTETARWSPILELEWEKARSLGASDRFVLFAADEAESNPGIDGGEVWTVKLGTAVGRRTAFTVLRAAATLEVADSSVAGDFTYVIGEAQGSWEGPGFAGHGIEASLFVRGDLSGAAPRQRWTAIGGRATLPTIPVLSEWGSRLVFGQVTYLIPLESLRMGMLGAPRVFLRAATGAGWSEGAEAVFETNLITGFRLSFFEFAVAVDAGESDLDAVVYGILRFPGGL
ncbi:MAG: hypothetical protein E4H28_06640 [Gemmatimonadales bacterium]|nr:MAG: hypothetical protein E4H28_06640 [Gemmatimonadales bacterium]